MKTNSKPNNIRLVPFVLIVALVTMTFCLISSAGTTLPSLFKTSANTQIPFLTDHIAPLDDRAITWDVQLNFSETGGTNDYVVFGEAPDARDGPPADSYDVAKPPAPMEPYIRACMKDGLPTPYINLWKDYRKYPDNQKTYNLTILWAPEDGESPTTITIQWSKVKLNTSQYDKVALYNSTGILVSNMLSTTSFSYTAPAGTTKTFKINCTVDTNKPQIINYSPATGTTGDSYIFNASVFDDLTPKSGLTVKVNWAHGGLSGNETMTSVGGNYFVKTITLDEYSTSALTYHFYAKDNAKVPNTNYTSAYTASVADNDLPTINTITGDTSGTTGETTTVSVTFSDNIGVTVATLFYKTASAGSYSSVSILGGSAGIVIPSNSVESWYYYVTVDDAAGTGPVGNPSVDGSIYFTVSVTDNDVPAILTITGNSVGTTGETTTVSMTFSDNIGVTVATLFYKTASAGSYSSTSILGGSAGIVIPSNSVESWYYYVTVDDAAGTGPVGNPSVDGSTYFTVSVTDNDVPSILTITGNSVGTTGETTTVSTTFSDNIGVTVATLFYKTASAGSYSSVSILGGSAGIVIPSNSVESWYYYVTVDDAAGTGPVGNPSVDGSTYFTVSVTDNDVPSILTITGNSVGTTGETTTVSTTFSDNIGVTVATLFYKTASAGSYSSDVDFGW